MKKWVVEIEKESGRVETRLVPARNKCTAISNCKNEGDTVLSCVPYTGQNVKVSGQRDEEEERGYGGYTFGYGLVCKPPGTSCMSSVTRTTELTRACLT